MNSSSLQTAPHPEMGFRHEAFFYAGMREFVDGAVEFISDSMDCGAPTLVVVGAVKIAALRERLGRDFALLEFADMAKVGRNPARIIPAWRDFLLRHGETAGSLRGIGEPIGPDRSPAELVECQRHESLLNLAFDNGRSWWLMCPYDTDALNADLLAEARHSHPFLARGSAHEPSAEYHGLEYFDQPFDAPLPQPPSIAREVAFDELPLTEVRALVASEAERAGMSAIRIADLVLAVNEVATNSLRYGGGTGTLRVWSDGRTMFCEIRDKGYVTSPLVGRERPRIDRAGGRGLWLANQLCDLVQLRSSPGGTTVRLHMSHA